MITYTNNVSLLLIAELFYEEYVISDWFTENPLELPRLLECIYYNFVSESLILTTYTYIYNITLVEMCAITKTTREMAS